jgi:4-diphosphocytidyl-2-C-methyl-D-erythritol kinase
MTGVVLRASAKVNFCLRLLGTRPDGYHEVETVLHTIGLWDQLHLSPLGRGGGIVLEVNTPEVPADESNLCCQAARLLAQRVGIHEGIAIRLEKAIPAGAGLGGGSSDAAATLAGLAHLWGLALPPGELESLAAQIGADVPFFLRGGCCLARGRGEKLAALPPLSAWLVLVVPPHRVPTAEAYAALPRTSGPAAEAGLSRTTQRALNAVRQGHLDTLAKSLHNDFETLDLPGIAEARAAKEALLEAGCLGANLSGSGSAVFGLARDRDAAERIVPRLKGRWPWVAALPTVPAAESLVIENTPEAR